MSLPRTVIVADDDPDLLALLSLHLKSWSFRVRAISSKGELLEALHQKTFAVLILDLQFGDHDGIEVLTQIYQQNIKQQTVFLTGCGTIDRAVQAIKVGAFDFLTKPVDLLRLRQLLEHIVDHGVQGRTAAVVDSPTHSQKSSILGDSPAIKRLRQLIEDVAKSDAKSLILGETGTGKELVARELHRLGHRCRGPFVPVSTAALPDTLAESVLFGHRKGAFTGADSDQIGCCEAADKGTLFLDEIGEMPLMLQAKLLRFLQGNSFQRIGSAETISVDVRIVAATNLTPKQMLDGGKLREDLYYRLNVIPIEVPPLRERDGDAALIASHLLESRRGCLGWRELRFSENVLEVFERYAWPGNVRQVEGIVERLAVTCRKEVIEVEHLPSEMHVSCDETGRSASAMKPFLSERSSLSPEKLMPMERLQKTAIQEALHKVEGNVVLAANLLGVGQATVYRKMKRFGITLPSERTREPATPPNIDRPS